MFAIGFTESALEDLRCLRKAEQKVVLEAIGHQLATEPVTVTRNRKSLRSNELSAWELRTGDLRVFYDVDSDRREVTVRAIGRKEHNKLLIRGKEFLL